MNCLLCQSDADPFEVETFLCPTCHLVFKNPSVFLSTDEDFKRYSSHQNCSEDQGYVDFLERLLDPLKPFLPQRFSALDFGCGPGPVLGTLLEDCGGDVENYDPLFYPDAHLLIPDSYDVVTCTEVVEHFKTPRTDWELLVGLVRDGGLLGVMTQYYNPTIDYQKWWYKNDPTHIVFYQKETFEFLAQLFNLEILYSDNKSITIFRKREDL